MIRSSNHTIKFSNSGKLVWIETLFQDYQLALQDYVDQIISEQLPLKKFLSSKKLPSSGNITGGQWKALVYKNASEIVRSQLQKTKDKTFKKYQKTYAICLKNNIHQKFLSKKYGELHINYLKRIPKIEIKNVSINLDQRFWNSTQRASFNEFIEIKLPYIKEGYKQHRKIIRIPIKQHKQSLKYKTWTRKNTIQLSKQGISFSYEKELPAKRKINKSIGIDIGYKKLISTSNEHYYGLELQKIYNKLARQKQGSKNFKQTLIERDNLINQFCNTFAKAEGFDQIVIENLYQVKHKSKFNKKLNNKLQRWSYPKVINKLERLSEEEGFLLTKVNPAYTSQTCSNCGIIDKSNRKGEIYQCKSCKITIDADFNAALNILHRGIYSSSGKENDSISFY